MVWNDIQEQFEKVARVELKDELIQRCSSGFRCKDFDAFKVYHCENPLYNFDEEWLLEFYKPCRYSVYVNRIKLISETVEVLRAFFNVPLTEDEILKVLPEYRDAGKLVFKLMFVYDYKESYAFKKLNEVKQLVVDFVKHAILYYNYEELNDYVNGIDPYTSLWNIIRPYTVKAVEQMYDYITSKVDARCCGNTASLLVCRECDAYPEDAEEEPLIVKDAKIHALLPSLPQDIVYVASTLINEDHFIAYRKLKAFARSNPDCLTDLIKYAIQCVTTFPHCNAEQNQCTSRFILFAKQ